jgi:hypothetical protein
VRHKRAVSQLADIQKMATGANVRTIVIGGLAVCEHGYARETEDLDVLVCKDDRGRWEELLEASGYSRFSAMPAFSQWEPKPEAVAKRLDIMYVNSSTFGKMWDGSQVRRFEGAEARVPCLDHLLALKLHAARSAPHRQLKDLTDIVYLIDANKIDVKSEKFEKLCLEFGTPDIYERLRGKQI